LGRGAAVAARADDPMVLMYNPAGLVELRGAQLMFNANTAWMDACVDPIGYYGWGVYGGGKPTRLTDPRTGATQTLNLGRANQIGPAETSFYQGAYDTVCLDQGLTPVPELAFTTRLGERLGLGAGLIFPSVTPQGMWGSSNAVIQGAGGLRPAATRYMEIRSGTIGLFPTLGLAYRIADWLRIGAAFRWGIINVDNSTMAAVQVGTTPANDLLVHVRATDWFIPEVTGSLHIVPFDAIDLVLGFHYQADLDAPGEIDITTGEYDATAKPLLQTNKVTGVHQKFPWSAWAALRYASRLAPRPHGSGHDDTSREHGGRVLDAFETERWDVEVDVQYELNARHRDLTITYVPDQQVRFVSLAGSMTMQAFPDVTMPATNMQKRWKDQLSIRAGGSYNILPGLFGVSAGVHYENRGVDPSYMQVDFWPLQRIGLHAGVKIRVASRIDLVFAYAHIFQETLTVSAPVHENFDKIGMQYVATGTVTNIDKRAGVPSSTMPLTPLEEPRPASSDGEARLTQNFAKALPGTPPVIINSGTYRSGFDIVSAGLNVHF
jgi:long-subunit fatty acid transport protein